MSRRSWDPGDVAAEDADGLRQRPDLDRDAAVQAEVVDRTATVPAEHARCMRVVDEDRRAVLLGRLDDRRQRGDVAVHAEDAVGHDEDQPIGQTRSLAALLARFPEDLAERLGVAVRIDLAGRLREAHPIDDRGVVQGVGDDEVLLAGDRRDDAGVGRESALERQDRLGFLEGREVALELLVERHRPGDRPDGARAGPEVPDRGQRRLAQPWMVGQPEVVIRRQADEPPVVDRDDRALGRRHDPQRPVEVAGPQVVELLAEEGERIGARVLGHTCQSMITLPESPDRAAANAASWSRNENRWVIAGRMSSPDWSMTVILYQVSYISRP